MAARRRRIESLIKPYRVTDGKGFQLKQVDPGDTQGLEKEAARESCNAAFGSWRPCRRSRSSAKPTWSSP